MKQAKVKRIEKHGNSHVIRVPLVLFIAMILALIGLTIVLWSAERGEDPRLNVKNAGDFATLLPSIIGLTQSSLDGGNKSSSSKMAISSSRFCCAISRP